MQKEYTHIFLVDDDEDDRLLFLDAFKEIKLTTKVTTFKNGAELMDYLHQTNNQLPEIIFLDLNMPIKNGMECLTEIKANPKFNNIAIAIYSTSSSEEYVEETFVKGANIYIQKPNDFEVLKKVLQEVVTLNWQYHTSGLNKQNFLLKI